MSSGFKKLLGYSGVILLIAIAYYLYSLSAYPPSEHRETFLSEVGEGVGEVALWVFLDIYFRTLVKLALGKGPLSRRLLPDYTAPATGTLLNSGLAFLDRSHTYLGVAAVMLTLLHVALMGLHREILFFPVVLALVIWQTCFGLFLVWRPIPKEIKRWSYFVHSQLVTGIAIGIFAYFGHRLLDD